MVNENFKSGFVSIVGRTNVGKSTLLNKIIGKKLTIISDKPQTTRHKISMVLTSDEAQIIFLDTPGIHKPKHKLGQRLVDIALRALNDMDVVLFMTEPCLPGPGDRFILTQLENVKRPVFLVVNKIDLVSDSELQTVLAAFQREYRFTEVLAVSALTGTNVDKLVKKIIGYLPEGPKYFPDDMLTDRPESFLMAEIIREKVMHLTSEEIPHSITVVVDQIDKRSDDLVAVHATIFVERESQKPIIIGKGGNMLKQVGRAAREEIEHLLGSRVYLDLWVKVKKDWRNREGLLRSFGYLEPD